VKVGDLVKTKTGSNSSHRFMLFEGHDIDEQYYGIITTWNENARVARVLLGDKDSGVLIHEEDLEVVNESR
jgi:hypothetical protein